MRHTAIATILGVALGTVAVVGAAHARNPHCAGGIQYVYTACQSQPCRTMHDYLWLGFNQDESGKKVVDGISNWIGGSTGIFTNFRFGQAGRTRGFSDGVYLRLFGRGDGHRRAGLGTAYAD